MKRAWHQQARRAGKDRRTVGGVVFDSASESKRWRELQFLQKAGHIKNLERQVDFPLVIEGRPVLTPSGKTTVVRADFVYEERGLVDNGHGGGTHTWQKVIEEHKGGFFDRYSRLKIAVLQAIYQVEVRVTGQERFEAQKERARLKKKPNGVTKAELAAAFKRMGRSK